MKFQLSVAVIKRVMGRSPIVCILMVLAALVGLVCLPVSADTKYLTGSPDISASISGSNEFSPGTTDPLQLSIQNTGLISSKMTESSVLDSGDVPSTAKMVLVSLEAGDAPVIIKSDSQMLGAIPASNAKSASFQIRVKDNARAGHYELPLHVKYTYLAEADQQGTESVTYRYTDRDKTINIPFVVRSAINLDVTGVSTQDLNAGGSGYLLATLKNTGINSGEKTIARINRSDGSPVVPVDGAVYIGTFAPGDEVNTKFKVAVSKDARGQEYPLDIYASYENTDGETLDTPTKRLGIPVGEKIKFSVINKPAEINAGEKKLIQVEYHNDGTSPAYKAEARVTVVDPFKSSDNLAYLGDILPGETAKAVFEIETSDTAEAKLYGLDSEIRFRDALETSQTTDTIKVPVKVIASSPVGFITADPLAILVLIGIIIGAGYYVATRRKISTSKLVRDN
jgi:hypothetical protein